MTDTLLAVGEVNLAPNPNLYTLISDPKS